MDHQPDQPDQARRRDAQISYLEFNGVEVPPEIASADEVEAFFHESMAALLNARTPLDELAAEWAPEWVSRWVRVTGKTKHMLSADLMGYFFLEWLREQGEQRGYRHSHEVEEFALSAVLSAVPHTGTVWHPIVRLLYGAKIRRRPVDPSAG